MTFRGLISPSCRVGRAYSAALSQEFLIEVKNCLTVHLSDIPIIIFFSLNVVWCISPSVLRVSQEVFAVLRASKIICPSCTSSMLGEAEISRKYALVLSQTGSFRSELKV